jgi:hypothetical protein
VWEVAIFDLDLEFSHDLQGTDLRTTDLGDTMAYIKGACGSIAEEVTDGTAPAPEPERKPPDDGDGGWLRPSKAGLFKHVDTVCG